MYKNVYAETTVEQRMAAVDAAKKRYEDGLQKTDRPGWTGGKCPVSEYRAILGEIAVANHVGFPWKNLVLYSPNWWDYRSPDIGGIIEVKSGPTFNDSDKRKGAQLIVFVEPQVKDIPMFDCGYDTCSHRWHKTMTGDVEILGWFDMADWDKRQHFGDFYKAAGTEFRSPHTLPIYEWATA